MAKRTKREEEERAEKIEWLREVIKPGDAVYTILRSVSKSGMSREIGVVVIPKDGSGPIHPNHAVATVIGERMGKGDGIKIGGCGMDMGFALVYALSRALYPEYACVGPSAPDRRRCPSNYHVNHRDADGPESFTLVHTDGYALRHAWL